VVSPRSMACAAARTTCSGASPASATSATVRAGPVSRIPSRTTISEPSSGRIVVCSATPERRVSFRRARGAEVVLAVRDLRRGRRAAEAIGRTVPAARLAVGEIDLAELASVRRFAQREAETARGLNVLINNAGTSGGPRHASADGYELQMATNYLGHFAVTGLLLPLVRPAGRIVTVASLMARRGHLSPGPCSPPGRPNVDRVPPVTGVPRRSGAGRG
jgi:hypothetical protein